MATGVPPAPRLGKELEFKILREDWFVYKLKDKSVLRIKPVLIKVFETDQINPETGKKILAFEGRNIVVVKSPENLKGTPTLPLPPPAEALKLDKEEVEMEETIYEPPWNYYELENGEKIKQKIVVVSVYRIKGKYDREGNPYYIVQSQPVVGSSMPRFVEPFPQLTEREIIKAFNPDFYSFFVGSPPRCCVPLFFLLHDPSYEWRLVERTPLKEILKLPNGLSTERVLARVIEAPRIAKINPDGSFELDFEKLERDDTYYSFSIEEDNFLAKKDQNTVTVFEVYKVKDKIFALPLYEVSLT